ncbi:hypothetical protein HPB52_013135 [Rhipicephalus sanguineus]|uniref:SNF2 N-terminal domain-containing protein n=1 Tax=Rhipicephalus sanguineus TaxID=34632 RepID=A0A9D4QEY0_RHISA|nr:hypothetical protein HPB52_013135 [Rhipicephalus sanguineus]
MDIKDLVFPDPRLDTMKAWTGGIPESSCGRSTEPAPSDMFPGFPSSGSSQAMPGSAPLNPGAAANPWFHQSAFSMAADIHSGASGTSSSSMAGSPYWLPPHQYAPAPAADPHQTRYGAGNDLYSASTSAAAPWWFGHNTSTVASGLHSSQYFQQHVTTSGDPMSNPFHAGLRNIHEAMSSPAATTPIQSIIPSSQHQSMGISGQHQRSLMSSSSSQQLAAVTDDLDTPEALSGADTSKSKWAKPEAGADAATENDAKECGQARRGGWLAHQEGQGEAEKGGKLEEEAEEDLLADAKKGFQRKNIRDIKNESDLDEVTLNAQKEEQERMKRLQEARLRALQSQGIAPGPAAHSAIGPIALESSSSSDDDDDSTSQSEDEAIPAAVPRRTGGDIGGIRFLFDNVVESVGRFDTSSGFGCILAHSMGLGKTIQVISFVDVLLRHTAARKVLCITPINTIQNWLAEFDKWVPAPEAVPQNWWIRANEAALPVDDEPEFGSLELPGSFADYVGADDDVAVCSEVSLDDIIETAEHRADGLTIAQNNLLEYWCMVDLCGPRTWGKRSEFCNMFERPIQNGQCLDSTPRTAAHALRAHVLHSCCRDLYREEWKHGKFPAVEEYLFRYVRELRPTGIAACRGISYSPALSRRASRRRLNALDGTKDDALWEGGDSGRGDDSQSDFSNQ